MLPDLISSLSLIISLLPTFASLVCIMYVWAFIFLLCDFIYRHIRLLITPSHKLQYYWMLDIPTENSIDSSLLLNDKYVFSPSQKILICFKIANEGATCWGKYLHDLLCLMGYCKWLWDTQYDRFQTRFYHNRSCDYANSFITQIPALKYILNTGFHKMYKHKE